MKIFISKLALISILLSGQPLLAQNLVEIYKLALLQDTQLLIAEADYLAAIERLPIAKSVRRPQIFFGLEAGAQDFDNSDLPDNTSENFGYSLNLTQNVYNHASISDVRSADALLVAQLAVLQAARQDLMLRTAEAYFTILAAQDNVEFTYSERNAISRQLEQAQKRFEVGLIAITDVHEAQARFDNAEAQVILSENILDDSYQALQVIIGEAPSRNLSRLGDDLKLIIPVPAIAESWVELALNNNRTLLAAQANQKALKYEREKFDKAYYPVVDLTARYSGIDTTQDFLPDNTQNELSLRLELLMPLYTGGRISAQRRQSASSYQAAKTTTLLQSRLASQQTRVAFSGVVSGISQVKALKQAYKSSNIALDATRAGFEVGTRTSVDVLISLRETFRTLRDYAGSRYEYLINTLKLRQAAGILEESDLHKINLWLTP
jgi:outer membrane protein